MIMRLSEEEIYQLVSEGLAARGITVAADHGRIVAINPDNDREVNIAEAEVFLDFDPIDLPPIRPRPTFPGGQPE